VSSYGQEPSEQKCNSAAAHSVDENQHPSERWQWLQQGKGYGKYKSDQDLCQHDTRGRSSERVFAAWVTENIKAKHQKKTSNQRSDLKWHLFTE
jgi:uncharacterized NAD(P)/FAD-binding protein YdhS